MRPDSIEILKIVFEQNRLPEYAYLLDAAAKMYGLPEETFEWFWRFCDPVPNAKQDSSENVLRHSRTLLERVEQMLDSRTGDWCILMRYPDVDPALVKAHWTHSLRLMIELAQRTKICHWVVGANVRSISEGQNSS
jgi:hypothetical protein